VFEVHPVLDRENNNNNNNLSCKLVHLALVSSIWRRLSAPHGAKYRCQHSSPPSLRCREALESKGRRPTQCLSNWTQRLSFCLTLLPSCSTLQARQYRLHVGRSHILEFAPKMNTLQKPVLRSCLQVSSAVNIISSNS